MKTQSTLQPTREAYLILLIDTLTKILSNLSLVFKMYNGPGIEIENKSKFWHGELWQQSPLFGEHSIIINSVEYFAEEFVHIIISYRLNCMRIIYIIFHNKNLKLKLQKFLRFEELPDRFKISECASNINTMWLLKDKPIIVDPGVLVSFVPFGRKFKDFIHPFLKELKELEKGKIINIQGKDTLVIMGLGLVTADLLQGNDLAGVIKHNAKKSCRFCMIEKHESLRSFDDLSKELHYHQLIDHEFEIY
ncbi:hypothetical protein C1646_775587 [Rhizophagus diaphanus]|nr:hypothetical protein C1646_775587 [Rhizophagus diaphanus] [Rhizophagus sp. MUCL 43196]